MTSESDFDWLIVTSGWLVTKWLELQLVTSHLQLFTIHLQLVISVNFSSHLLVTKNNLNSLCLIVRGGRSDHATICGGTVFWYCDGSSWEDGKLRPFLDL